MWRLRSAFLVYLVSCAGFLILPSFILGALAALHPVLATLINFLVIPAMFGLIAIVNCRSFTPATPLPLGVIPLRDAAA